MTAAMHRGGRPIQPRPFTVAAVLEHTGLSLRRLAFLLGRPERTIGRWNATGLTDTQADEIACELGRHPTEIWGQDWWALAPEWTDEDDE